MFVLDAPALLGFAAMIASLSALIWSTRAWSSSDCLRRLRHRLLAAVRSNAPPLPHTGVLCAALLHDTVEDTQTSFAELEERFGAQVASIVREVTDDKALTKVERKRLQVDKASTKSREAKLVKLADKISNLRDILTYPPVDWSANRKAEYFEWAAKVVQGMRGTSAILEAEFDELLASGRRQFGEVQA